MATTQLGGAPGMLESMETMSGGQRAGFVEHVFRFDTETRSELLNITQYGLLATPLIFMMNKVVQRAFPEVDDSKSSLEIGAEVVGQLVSLIVALFFIHRLITFVPTYSEVGYTHLNYLAVIVAVLTVILSIQSKLGEKVMILADRLSMATIGSPISEDAASKRKSNKGGAPAKTVPVHQPSQADYVSVAPGMSMPNTGGGMPEYAHPSMVPPQQSPMMAPSTQPSNTGMNYDAMHMGSTMFEPMAANGAIGGGFGSPW